jgi:single-strand DNA-binding protein
LKGKKKMANLNKVMLIGRVGRDPESVNTTAGSTVCKFSLATDESYKDKNGNKVERTEWHNIVTFGTLAVNCGNLLTKGMLVYIEGKIKTETWDKDGVKQYKTMIGATVMQILEKKEAKPAPSSYNQAKGFNPTAEDDIPF